MGVRTGNPAWVDSTDSADAAANPSRKITAAKLNAIEAAIDTLGDKADVAIPSLAPAYAGTRSRHFDALTGVYGGSYSDAGWRARIAATKVAGNRSTTVAVIGSSTVAGYGSPGVDSWGLRLRAKLASAGCTVQGTGVTFVGMAKSESDPRWTFSGTVTQAAVRMHAEIAAGAWAQFASDVAGQNVRIHYLNNGGPFTYSIDGAGAVTVTPSGASTSASVTVSGLANTTHTVRTTGSSGTALVIGVEVYSDTDGLNVTVGGVSGSVTANWTGLTAGDNLHSARLRAPALTIVSMGGNDCAASVPIETYKTNMRTLIGWNTFSSSATMLVAMPHANTMTLAEWQPYVSALYDISDEYDVPLVDMTYRWGSLTNATYGNLMTDFVHPNTAGHEDYATAVASALGM